MPIKKDTPSIREYGKKSLPFQNISKSKDWDRITKNDKETPVLYFSNAYNHLSDKNISGKILGKYIGLDENKVKIGYGKYGKPFLEEFPDIHFNVSHTANAFILAVSDRPIGIDIEKKRKINRRIVKKFFTETEQKFVHEDNHQKDERFTRIWTMKESYVKYTGRGLRQSFETFDVLEIYGLISFFTGIIMLLYVRKVSFNINAVRKLI